MTFVSAEEMCDKAGPEQGVSGGCTTAPSYKRVGACGPPRAPQMSVLSLARPGAHLQAALEHVPWHFGRMPMWCDAKKAVVNLESLQGEGLSLLPLLLVQRGSAFFYWYQAARKRTPSSILKHPSRDLEM